MKAFLVFVILVFLGLLGATWHFKTRPTEAHRQIIADLKEELATAEREQAELRIELSRARAELATVKVLGPQPASAPSFAASPSAPSAPASSAPAAPPSTGIDARLAQLRTIYDNNLRALEADREKATLTLRTAKEQREYLQRNPPSFKEQTQVTDIDGSIVGNRGVRTSNSDRNRAMALHREKIEQLDRSILENEQKLKEIDQRRALLDEQYRNAVAKARADSTWSGQ